MASSTRTTIRYRHLILAGFVVVVVFLLFTIAKQNETLNADVSALHEEFKALERSNDRSKENITRELVAERTIIKEQLDHVSTVIVRANATLTKDISIVDRRLYEELIRLGEQIATFGVALSDLQTITRGSATSALAQVDEYGLSAIAAIYPIGAKAIADQPGRLAFDAGLEEYGAGRYRESCRLFLKSSQYDPGNSRTRAYMAAAEYLADPTMGRGQGTRQILESYISQSGPDALILRCLIRIASETADWKSVSSYYSSLSIASSLSTIDYEEMAWAAKFAGENLDD